MIMMLILFTVYDSLGWVKEALVEIKKSIQFFSIYSSSFSCHWSSWMREKIRPLIREDYSESLC